MERKFSLEQLKEDGMKCQTIRGLPVRILCTDRKDNDGFILVGLVNDEDNEYIESWTESGIYSLSDNDHPFILVNLPAQEKQLWTNIYEDCGNRSIGQLYSSETDAKDNIDNTRTYIKTVLIDEWEV